MPERRSVGLLCLGILVIIGACEEKAGSGSSASSTTPHRGGGEAEDRGEGLVEPSIPDAKALGIEGWQEATWTGTRTLTQLEQGSLSHSTGALRRIAEDRPELAVIDDDEGHSYLVGPVEPTDAAAIMAVLSSAEVKAQNIASVPPGKEIMSLGEMAAAAIQLIGEEPSAEALVGSDADPAIVARLERAASGWPAEARVHRVIGLPPDADDEPAVLFGPDNDAEDDRDEQSHRRLQDMGILEFAPIKGGGIGDLITGQVELQYQGNDQLDRTLHVKFAFDPATDRWAMISMLSMPNMATVSRLMRAGEAEKVNSMAHTLDFVSLLSECHLVVGKGGPLLCK